MEEQLLGMREVVGSVLSTSKTKRNKNEKKKKQLVRQQGEK
jgi:hypothetical protein